MCILANAKQLWILFTALEEELKVLDTVLWLNYYFVLLDCFPFFLYFLTSQFKLSLELGLGGFSFLLKNKRWGFGGISLERFQKRSSQFHSLCTQSGMKDVPCVPRRMSRLCFIESSQKTTELPTFWRWWDYHLFLNYIWYIWVHSWPILSYFILPLEISGTKRLSGLGVIWYRANG